MATISANRVKDLREKTGAGMMDAKKALQETGGDFEKAVDLLRKKGLSAAAKKSSRIAAEGVVTSYIHMGGKIGVMTGLLKAAKNQDQVAAVIGHEIAHVTARHANERASRGSFSNVGVQVAAVLLGGGHQGATYSAYEALQAGASLGIMLPFSRSQESEADVIGLTYMARAGFDPRESVPLWQNMEGEADEAPAEILSTHPSSDTRIDQLVGEFGPALKIYNEAKEAGRNPNCTL